MPGLPSGTLTFLFTDVKGSTLLIQDPSVDGGRRLIQTQETVRSILGSSGGHEVHCAGDGFFFVFASAPDAIKGALAVQEELARNPTQVRIGMHTGHALQWDGEYMGIDVHLAARIAAAAHGGQILLSRSTRELVNCRVTDLGLHQLKDIAEPVHLYQAGSGMFGPIASWGRSSLPTPPTEFVGRTRELAAVNRLLADEGIRLLTLTGPGGIGKTRLAIQIAKLRSAHYPEGSWWIDLTSVQEAQLVQEAITRVFGSQGDLAPFIGQKRCALVLDNFEHVLDAAGFVGDLVRRCPNLVVIVTSRASLRLSGEWRFVVEPLAEQEAVTLFCSRALAAGVVLPRTEDVSAICRRVESVPLALELAAAKCVSLNPAELLSRLNERLYFLGASVDDLPDRHRTLRATVQWSYELLDVNERRIFCRLCVFAGGWSAESARDVFGADLSVIENLIKKSFVRMLDGRFFMLEVIREFGIERLETDPAEAMQARCAHRDHFLALVERQHRLQEISSANWLSSFQELRREHDNIRAALLFSSRSIEGPGGHAAALRFCGALRLYWTSRWHCQEGLRACISALAGRQSHSDLFAVARVVGAAASLSAFVGELDRAGPFYEEALTLFGELGQRDAEAMVCSDAGHLEYMLGNFDAAKFRFTRLAQLAARLGDEKLAANAQYGFGRVALAEKQHDLSHQHFDNALAGYLRVQHRSNQALALLNLGTLAYAGGDAAMALAHLTRALSLAREAGDEMIENSIVRCLGDVEAIRGNHSAAKLLLKQALEANLQTDDMLEVTLCLRSAALLVFRVGDLAQGAELLGAAMRVGARFERLLGALLTHEERTLLDAARHALAGHFDSLERLGQRLSARSAIEMSLRLLSHKPSGIGLARVRQTRPPARAGQPSMRRRGRAE